MISFIVPAHNEQAGLGGTLRAIHEAGRMAGRQYEVIVVDDASTDATAQIARQNNARVVSVNHRQIAATRNAGGRAAQGERLFFVDADTTFKPRAVASALRQMDRAAAGGGAPAQFDAAAPLYARLLLWWFNLFARLAGISGGAFLFCTREAFQATGGFDERLFGAEDAAMSWALKRQGRFVVLWHHVLTSGRRMRGLRGLQMLATLVRMALVVWPCAYFLLRLLFRQTRWLERVKIVALLALCLWSGWTATQVVVWFWPALWGRLAQGLMG